MPISYPLHFSAQLRQHLRALRQQRGLTQAQLGARIGVSQARIAEIEANPGLVNLDQILQLLAALDVSLSIQDSVPAAPPSDTTSATSLFQSANASASLNTAAVHDRNAKEPARIPKTIRRYPIKETSPPLKVEQPAMEAYFTQLSQPKKGSW